MIVRLSFALGRKVDLEPFDEDTAAYVASVMRQAKEVVKTLEAEGWHVDVRPGSIEDVTA